MVEVLSYLRANDFKIFLVSGADRAYTRVMAEVLPVDSDNILGTDYRFVAANQKDKDGMEYVFTANDKVVRGEFEVKNINMNKVSVMAREIGKQPVLAFGNSGGDFSMYNYTTTNQHYKTTVFSLLADDTEKEFGNPASAEKMLKKAAKNCAEFDNVSFSAADITALPFMDDSFDKVVAGNVIHLLDDPLNALAELNRVCKDDGTLIIPTYMNNDTKGRTSRFAKAAGKAGADFKRQFTIQSYRQFFLDAGYSDVNVKLADGRIPCAVAVMKKVIG